MFKFLLTVFTGLLFVCSATLADSKLFAGFVPSIPDTLSTFFAETPSPYVPSFKQTILLLEIDKKGRLKKVQAENEADSLLVPYIRPYLASLSYSPAELKNKKINSVLPVQVTIKRKNDSPEFVFPLLNQKQPDISRLYVAAMAYNKITCPEITAFPAYFSENLPTDSSREYPYAIFRVTFDKEGKMTAIKPKSSFKTGFTDQLRSAVLHAEISPLKVNGKIEAAEIDVMVSLFPQLSYPTRIYKNDDKKPKKLLENRRVRVLPPLSNYLSEPLPRNLESEVIAVSTFETPFYGRQQAYIYIDTAGQATLLQTENNQKQMIRNFRLLLKKLRFYPALDIDGLKKDYFGYIEIEPKDRLSVRISYLWLR